MEQGGVLKQIADINAKMWPGSLTKFIFLVTDGKEITTFQILTLKFVLNKQHKVTLEALLENKT